MDDIRNILNDFFTKLWGNLTNEFWDKLLEWIYNKIFSAISDFLVLIQDVSSDLFDFPWVKSFIKLFEYFGWALFIIGAVIAIFDIAIEYQNTKGINFKRQILPIFYGFLGVGLFTIVPIRLFSFCVGLQGSFMNSISAQFSSNVIEKGNYVSAAHSALSLLSDVPSLLNIFMLIAIGYSVVKVFFGSVKRGGILLTQIAVGSLYMFSLPKGYVDGFLGWSKKVIALCLTAFLQTTLLYIGLLTFNSNVLLGIGVMLAADEVPMIANQFGLDTSIRGGIKGVANSTASAIKITRTIAGGI